MTAMIDLRRLIEDVLVPGIQEIRTKVTAIELDMRGINTRLDNLDKRIDNLEKRIDGVEKSLGSRIDSLEARMGSLERQILCMREDFKLAIDLHERIATIEAKLSSH